MKFETKAPTGDFDLAVIGAGSAGFSAAITAAEGGKRVALTPAARPRTAMDQPYDFTATHPADGFSPAMPLMAYFKGGVSTTGVVFHSDDPQRSLQPDSRVVLLDTTSNTLVPVWAEVDRNTDEPTEQAFLIRPFQRLQEQRPQPSGVHRGVAVRGRRHVGIRRPRQLAPR